MPASVSVACFKLLVCSALPRQVTPYQRRPDSNPDFLLSQSTKLLTSDFAQSRPLELSAIRTLLSSHPVGSTTPIKFQGYPSCLSSCPMLSDPISLIRVLVLVFAVHVHNDTLLGDQALHVDNPLNKTLFCYDELGPL
jgi:hypothetical protein